MRTSHKLRFLREQRFKILRREFEIRSRWDPPFDFEVLPLRHPQPWVNVGFVFDFCYDDFRAGGELEGDAEIHEELGC